MTATGRHSVSCSYLAAKRGVLHGPECRGGLTMTESSLRSSRCRPAFRRLHLGAACLLFLTTAPALAHPHVWVTMNEELLYAADGSLTGIRHAWTFDETFSAFATQGLSAKDKGKFTREELKPLAQTNIESLKEYRYFTYARIDGKKQKDAFGDPVDYWLEFDPKKTELTLHLTMPFKHPVLAKQLVIEVFDPEFFVDFGFADNNPVKLANAPANCSVSTEKPEDPSFTSTTKLGQLFSTSEANIGMGMNFANKISVECR
jgi:ABC-type uncharacterized transport system substrate-binding protein